MTRQSRARRDRNQVRWLINHPFHRHGTHVVNVVHILIFESCVENRRLLASISKRAPGLLQGKNNIPSLRTLFSF